MLCAYCPLLTVPQYPDGITGSSSPSLSSSPLSSQPIPDSAAGTSSNPHPSSDIPPVQSPIPAEIKSLVPGYSRSPVSHSESHNATVSMEPSCQQCSSLEVLTPTDEDFCRISSDILKETVNRAFRLSKNAVLGFFIKVS